MKNILFSLILIQFVCGFAWAKTKIDTLTEDLHHGPEWTFTLHRTEPVHDDLFGEELYHRKRALWDYYVKYCAKTRLCAIDKSDSPIIYGNFKVKFNNGLEIEITNDPGVIEIKATKFTKKFIQDNVQFIEENVFQVMKKHGLVPHEISGSGHNNIDLNYFKNKPLLLYNFIVDFYNNPAVGIVLNSLANNREYARDLNQMKEMIYALTGEQHVNFVQDLNSIYDRTYKFAKKFKSHPESIKTVDVVNHFWTVLNLKYAALGMRGDFRKSHSLLAESSRLELRTLRPQESINHYLLVLQFIEERLAYLEKIKSPLLLVKVPDYHDGWNILGDYAAYLEEANMSYKKYKPLMPEVWRNLDTKQFVKSHRFSQHKPMKMVCEGLFK